MTTTTTLTQDVAEHWQKCLEVNSSWRQFTHELAVLNTIDMLCIEDVEFVAELLQDNELFEDEDFDELQFACFEFVTELDEVPVDEIDVVVGSGDIRQPAYYGAPAECQRSTVNTTSGWFSRRNHQHSGCPSDNRVTTVGSTETSVCRATGYSATAAVTPKKLRCIKNIKT